MSYSATEPALLLAFRARLCGITTEAQSIRELSAQMRQARDTTVQGMMLQVWLAAVSQTPHPTRLLALFYLANDVVQLLRGSEQMLHYRYSFAVPMAEAVVVIRRRAPTVVPKIARVIAILKERCIFDTHTVGLLQRAVEEEVHDVVQKVLPSLQNEIATRRQERIQQLKEELNRLSSSSSVRCSSDVTSSGSGMLSGPGISKHESLKRSETPSATSDAVKTGSAARSLSPPTSSNVPAAQVPSAFAVPVVVAPPLLSASSLSSRRTSLSSTPTVWPVEAAATLPQVTPLFYNAPAAVPSLESYLAAERELTACHALSRPESAINQDAEILSQVRRLGRGVDAENGAPTEEKEMLNHYKGLLEFYNEKLQDMQEKVGRRRKEEERNSFLLYGSAAQTPTSLPASTAAVSLYGAAGESKTARHRVEVLLRKEWQLRCDKAEIEHTLYWHLVDLFELYVKRRKVLDQILHDAETEAQRRGMVLLDPARKA